MAVKEREVVIQTAASSKCRADIGVVNNERRLVGTFQADRSGQSVDERHHTLRGIAENNAALVGIGTRILVLGVKPNLNLAAHILVELVGSAQDGAVINRVIRRGKGAAIVKGCIHRCLRRQIRVSGKDIDTGDRLFLWSSRR